MMKMTVWKSPMYLTAQDAVFNGQDASGAGSRLEAGDHWIGRALIAHLILNWLNSNDSETI
jgi:hypothetical protein